MKPLLTSLAAIAIATKCYVNAGCVANSNDDEKAVENCPNHNENDCKNDHYAKDNCHWNDETGIQPFRLQEKTLDFWVHIAMKGDQQIIRKRAKKEVVHNIKINNTLFKMYNSHCDYVHYADQCKEFECEIEDFHVTEKKAETHISLKLDVKLEEITHPMRVPATLIFRKWIEKRKGVFDKNKKCVLQPQYHLKVYVLISPIISSAEPMQYFISRKDLMEKAADSYRAYKRALYSHASRKKFDDIWYQYISVPHTMHHVHILLTSELTDKYINGYNGLVLFGGVMDDKNVKTPLNDQSVFKQYGPLHAQNLKLTYNSLSTTGDHWQIDTKRVTKTVQQILSLTGDKVDIKLLQMPINPIQLFDNDWNKQPFRAQWKHQGQLPYITKELKESVFQKYEPRKYAHTTLDNVELYLFGVKHLNKEFVAETVEQIKSIKPDVIILEYDSLRFMPHLEKNGIALERYSGSLTKLKRYQQILKMHEFLAAWDTVQFDPNKITILADLPGPFVSNNVLGKITGITNKGLYEGIMTNARNHFMAAITNKAAQKYHNTKKKYFLLVGVGHTGWKELDKEDWEYTSTPIWKYANGIGLHNLFTDQYHKLQTVVTKTNDGKYVINVALPPYVENQEINYIHYNRDGDHRHIRTHDNSKDKLLFDKRINYNPLIMTYLMDIVIVDGILMIGMVCCIIGAVFGVVVAIQRHQAHFFKH